MEGQWSLIRCSFISTRNLIYWNTRTNLWQSLYTNCSFAPVKDPKESAFSTKNISDQVLLTIMRPQTYLKKGGNAWYWSQEKNICSCICQPDAEHPEMLQLLQSLKMNQGHLKLQRGRVKLPDLSTKMPLAGLLAWLEKPFYQLTESTLSTAEGSSWAFHS